MADTWRSNEEVPSRSIGTSGTVDACIKLPLVGCSLICTWRSNEEDSTRFMGTDGTVAACRELPLLCCSLVAGKAALTNSGSWRSHSTTGNGGAARRLPALGQLVMQ